MMSIRVEYEIQVSRYPGMYILTHNKEDIDFSEMINKYSPSFIPTLYYACKGL